MPGIWPILVFKKNALKDFLLLMKVVRPMKQIKCISAVLILNFAIAEAAFSQNSPKAEVETIRKTIEKTHRDIDWNAFDAASKVSIDSINFDTIHGLWKAYNGLFKFNGAVNSMVLTTPLEIEFKDDGYRPGSQSTFKKLMLTGNHIESKEEDVHGYINKITDKLLVITWNRGANYFRYYYER
jgi:hypothetical protein